MLRPMTQYSETGTKNRYQKTRTVFLHGVEQCSNPYQVSFTGVEQYSNLYQVSLPENIGIEFHDTPAGKFLVPVSG